MGTVDRVKSPAENGLQRKMINEIIAIYPMTDDLLKAIGHSKDCRRTMSDAEILTTAWVAALFCNCFSLKSLSVALSPKCYPNLGLIIVYTRSLIGWMTCLLKWEWYFKTSMI